VKHTFWQKVGRWAVVGTLLAASNLLAHHSGAAYDGQKTLKLEGSVESWRFANPHCSLQIQAADGAGQTIAWSFEGNPAGMMQQLGYRRNTFIPDAKVTVFYNPMKDGRPGGGRLVGAILSDGSTVGQVPAP
jgi:hypothetical protein